MPGNVDPMRWLRVLCLCAAGWWPAAVCGGDAGAELRDLPVGESLEYGIYWGILPAGHAVIRCETTNIGDRAFVCVRLRAQSNRLAGLIYPVDDQIECVVDPATRLPVYTRKRTVEGGFLCDDTLSFDRAGLTAHWVSLSTGITTNYPIAADTLDAVSFLYALRTEPFTVNVWRRFALAVDGRVHGVKVMATGTNTVHIPEIGTVPCLRFVAAQEQQGLFVRKIPEEIWVTADRRRMVTRIRGKVPIGRFSLVLKRAELPAAPGGISPESKGLGGG